eukprot:scaffold4318_cov182-Pinguiococcus_pyrenoidosus.AAC.2
MSQTSKYLGNAADAAVNIATIVREASKRNQGCSSAALMDSILSGASNGSRPSLSNSFLQILSNAMSYTSLSILQAECITEEEMKKTASSCAIVAFR